MMSGNLSHSVTQSGFWFFSLRILSRGLGFIRTIILARLLMPVDFGVIGIAMTVIATVELLSQTGFHAALVQKQDCSRVHLDTAWTVLVIRGLGLFVILFLASPFIAHFFSIPDISLVVKVIAVSVIFSGFRNIGIVSFNKNLRYDKYFAYELSGVLVDLIVSVGLAFLLKNVWAIVWGGFAGNLARLLMSYQLSDYRPKFLLDRASFRDLFSFGKWLFITGVVSSLLTQADNMTVGKLLGPAALGFYQMAMLISYLSSSEISAVIANITLPAYSLMQEDLKRIKLAYLDVLRFTIFLSLPISALIFVLSTESVTLFLGKDWLPAASCMQILALSGIFMSITSLGMPVYSARGVPKVETYLQSINLVVLLTLIYPLTKLYGINGSAMAILTGNATVMLLSIWYVSRLTETTVRSILGIIAFPAVNAGVMMLSIYSVKRLIPWDGFSQFVLCLVVAVITYLLLSILLDRITGFGIVPLLKEKAKSLIVQ
jgi:O-antigen/teichoic acid export membrane protein